MKQNVSIPVIGNGDVFSYEDIEKMRLFTGCDGVMIARGALGNPFIFSPDTPTKEEIINTALLHLKLIVEHKGEYTGIREARKHMSWYIKGMYNAAKFKNEICSAVTYNEMKSILENVLL